jgi:hypothetical protein
MRSPGLTGWGAGGMFAALSAPRNRRQIGYRLAAFTISQDQ